jgi:hypothetical protein
MRELAIHAWGDLALAGKVRHKSHFARGYSP